MGTIEDINDGMATTAHKWDAVFRALATAWLLSTIVFISGYQKGALGYAGYSSNGVEHVEAGTTPIALVLALIGLVFFSVLARTELRVGNFQIAPLWRRYIALLVDFWFFVFTYAALFAMIPLALEARHTGTFQWAFERDGSISSDWVGDALILIGLAAMPAYFVLTLANRRQTLGRWMLRIATVNVDGNAVRVPVFVALRRTYREVRELLSPSALWGMVTGKPVDEGARYHDDDHFIVVRY